MGIRAAASSQKHLQQCISALCVAVCCCVLLCVAVYCSVLQCVAVCCSVLQRVAVCCSAEIPVQQHHPRSLRSYTYMHSVLQCVAVCCSVLQCVAVCCSANTRAAASSQKRLELLTNDQPLTSHTYDLFLHTSKSNPQTVCVYM